MHPRSKHWHMIDFIIVHQRDVRDVHVTCVMRVTECWDDYRLVRVILTLNYHNFTETDTKLLRFHTSLQLLDEKRRDCLTPEGSTRKCPSFRGTFAETARDILREKARIREDWFEQNNEKIKESLHEKKKSYSECLHDPSSVSKCDRLKTLEAKVQSDLRMMKFQTG